MSMQQRLDEQHTKTIFSETPPFPKVLMIEPASACNQSCFFCGNTHKPHPKYNMPLDVAKKNLTECFEAGTQEVGFYLRGEPFLNSDLPQMIAWAKRLGYKYIYISTNGSVGSHDDFKKVIDAGLDSFKFSINAGTKEEYKEVHGRDVFDKVMDRLSFVIAYRKESNRNFKIFVSSTYTEKTYENIFSMKKKYEKRIDEFYLHGTCRVPGGEGHDVIRHFTAPCPMVFNRLHVTAENYLNICCFDFHNMLAIADLNTTSIVDAWNSEKFVEIRRKHLQNDLNGTLCGCCVNDGIGEYLPLILTLSERD